MQIHAYERTYFQQAMVQNNNFVLSFTELLSNLNEMNSNEITLEVFCSYIFDWEKDHHELILLQHLPLLHIL